LAEWDERARVENISKPAIQTMAEQMTEETTP